MTQLTEHTYIVYTLSCDPASLVLATAKLAQRQTSRLSISILTLNEIVKSRSFGDAKNI